MQDFISEDDLKTFDGWLKYQCVDKAMLTPEELERWQRYFDDARRRSAAVPKVGRIKLQPVPGEYLYAVAVEEGPDLWLALWVRRSRKGEFFVMLPVNDRDRDPHTSYHLDGTRHMKSYDQPFPRKKERRQPLTGTFSGTESLGAYAGYSPKSVGAICDPTAFAGVVKVRPGVLGPKHGVITVDLVEPGKEPMGYPWDEIIDRRDFRHFTPWLVITVGLLKP